MPADPQALIEAGLAYLRGLDPEAAADVERRPDDPRPSIVVAGRAPDAVAALLSGAADVTIHPAPVGPGAARLEAAVHRLEDTAGLVFVTDTDTDTPPTEPETILLIEATKYVRFALFVTTNPGREHRGWLHTHAPRYKDSPWYEVPPQTAELRQAVADVAAITRLHRHADTLRGIRSACIRIDDELGDAILATGAAGPAAVDPADRERSRLATSDWPGTLATEAERARSIATEQLHQHMVSLRDQPIDDLALTLANLAHRFNRSTEFRSGRVVEQVIPSVLDPRASFRLARPINARLRAALTGRPRRAEGDLVVMSPAATRIVRTRPSIDLTVPGINLHPAPGAAADATLAEAGDVLAEEIGRWYAGLRDALTAALAEAVELRTAQLDAHAADIRSFASLADPERGDHRAARTAAREALRDRIRRLDSAILEVRPTTAPDRRGGVAGGQ